MGEKAGRTLALTTPRRLIGDLLHFARAVPTVPVQRRVNLADLVEVRWPSGALSTLSAPELVTTGEFCKLLGPLSVSPLSLGVTVLSASPAGCRLMPSLPLFP